MRLPRWLTKATITRPAYVSLIAFQRQQWFPKRASLLRSTCIACSVILFLLLRLSRSRNGSVGIATR